MITTLSDFDAMVAELVARDVPRDKAEAAARKQFGMKSQLEEMRDDADREALEDDVVAKGDDLMRALGFDFVVKLSQKRRSKVTEGIPDRRYYHRRRRLFVWWEAKAERGRQSPAQRVFQEICDACGDPYVLGGLAPLRAWLTDHQVAMFDERGLPHPTPST